MKIAPVSADLLIKLALGALVIGAGVYLVRGGVQSIKGALDKITGLPGAALDYVTEAAKSGGEAFKAQYEENTSPFGGPPGSATAYGGKYKGPLVNDQGMDFGSLSG